MAYSVSNLKADLTGVIHGTTLNKIQGIDLLINRAARQFLLEVDPQETMRLAPLAIPLNNNQFEYPAPSDLKGDKVVDIRPQVNRSPGEIYLQEYNQQFDVEKLWTLQPSFTVQWNTAVKTLRVNAPYLNTNIVINSADDPTDNGTWSAVAPASNLQQNTQNFVYSSGSLQFDLAAGAPATGVVENATMSSVNLETHELISQIYYWVYLPTASNFTSVTLRWGSSNADYWQSTATTDAQGNAFVDGWNQLKADWSTATVVGAPDASAVDYLYAGYSYNGTAMNGVLLNQIISMKGHIFNIAYYSKCLFRTSAGVFIETVTDDSNLINLDTETYDVFFNQVAYLCVQQAFDGSAPSDYAFFKDRYDKGVARYQALYKSQLQKPQTTYYQMQSPSYRQYFGRNTY